MTNPEFTNKIYFSSLREVVVLVKVATRKKKIVPRAKFRKGFRDLSWDDWETWSPEKFDQKRRYAFQYYRDEFNPNDLLKSLYEWMLSKGYSKSDVAAIKATPPWKISDHTCIMAKCLLTGMPDCHEDWRHYIRSLPGTSDDLPEPPYEYLKNLIDTLIQDGRSIIKNRKQKETVQTPVPTVQDRIKEQAFSATHEIEEWLESFVKNKRSFDSNFDVNAHFMSKNISQAHARKIKNIYEPEMLELQKLVNKPTPTKLKKLSQSEQDDYEQLIEGYSHLSKTHVKKYLSALEKIVNTCDMIIQQGKETRKPRKQKVKTAKDLTIKLKYKINDPKYNLASINPQKVIGAKELWVFNTKTRKIGKYVAEDNSTFSIKGTTLQFFDKEKSTQRTLRKPNEQLKTFNEQGKVGLRTYLENIKTMETKLSGRFNADIIILKAY